MAIIEEAILLLDEYVFDCWEKQPVVKVEYDKFSCDKDECRLIVEDGQKNSSEAFSLCTTFINGYLLAKGCIL